MSWNRNAVSVILAFSALPAALGAATVSVAIVPTSATLAIGQTRQFTATVRNSSNTGVGWQVNGVTGGNSTVGTINATGLYTAPAAVPRPATVTVTAVSKANSTESASAIMFLTPPQVAVSISPASVSVQPGGSQQFAATLVNTTNTAVTWEVNGVIGGSPTPARLQRRESIPRPLRFPVPPS